MQNKSYPRRFLEILGTISFVFCLQWVLHPMAEHETLVRRRNDINRVPDTYYVEGKPSTIEKNSPNDLEELLDITLVIPAFNEAIRLPIMLDDSLSFLKSWCLSQRLSYELLIVDDASSDRTTEVVLEYSKRHSDIIRMLRLGENHGKGGAVKLGVQRARGKYILMVDADGATDIRDLQSLYAQLKKVEQSTPDLGGSPLGLALGSRAHLQENSIATRAFYRTLLMRGFHVLVMLLCTRNIKDTQCGFKLFTRKTAKILFTSLHLERWAFDIELIFLAEKLNIPMTEVAVRWHEVDGSKLIQTKLDVVKTSLTMARDMLFVRLAYTSGLWKVEL